MKKAVKLGCFALLAAMAAWVVHDISVPTMQIGFDTWAYLLGVSMLVGAGAGWFCRRVLVLIVAALALSYLVPYAVYYVPAIVEGSDLREFHAWAPGFIPQMMLYGSPAIWIAAGLAHAARSRYAGKAYAEEPASGRRGSRNPDGARQSP